MAYIINYNTYNSPVKKKRLFIHKRYWIIALCFILVLAIFVPARERVLDYLLFGNGEIAIESFSKMLDDIKSGSSIYEAFEAFCVEIIQYG